MTSVIPTLSEAFIDISFKVWQTSNSSGLVTPLIIIGFSLSVPGVGVGVGVAVLVGVCVCVGVFVLVGV